MKENNMYQFVYITRMVSAAGTGCGASLFGGVIFLVVFLVFAICFSKVLFAPGVLVTAIGFKLFGMEWLSKNVWISAIVSSAIIAAILGFVTKRRFWLSYFILAFAILGTAWHYEYEEMKFSVNHPIALVNTAYDAMYGGTFGMAVDPKKAVIVADNVNVRYIPEENKTGSYFFMKNETVIIRRNGENWVYVSGVKYHGWVTQDKVRLVSTE